MPSSGLRVGVAFGGRSVEHDVSIITGIQAVEALSQRHRPLPIYIARSGRWYVGEELRDLSSYSQGEPKGIEVTFDLHQGRLLPVVAQSSLLSRRRSQEPIELDVVVLATHGTQGEDGCLQGALELARIPYVGPPVAAAAVAMDKAMSKAVLAAAGLPTLPCLALRRESFESDPAAVQSQIASRFQLPVYVKPASLGSSVGVSRCVHPSELRDALQLVFELDRVCLVEPSIEGGIEVNCAVIGRPGSRPKASVCEQPVAGEHFLSFEDKYLRGREGAKPAVGVAARPSVSSASQEQAVAAGVKGAAAGFGASARAKGAGGSGASAGVKGGGPGMQGAKRLIPAPISQQATERVQDLACQAFEALGCAGVTRVDFLIDKDGEVYVNECNTIPGSFSFYLWEPVGLPFAHLMDELIDIAFAEHAERQKTTTVFDTSLLSERAGGGKA